MPTAQPQRRNVELTVAYLGDLLRSAGFIDDQQRAEIEALDRHARARGGKRGDEAPSPFKTISSLNLNDASGQESRIDEFLLARLVAEDAGLEFFKIDPLKLDVELIESKISRPFAKKHRMVPVHVRDGKLLVAVVNPFDAAAIEAYRPIAGQDLRARRLRRDRRHVGHQRVLRLPHLGHEGGEAT